MKMRSETRETVRGSFQEQLARAASKKVLLLTVISCVLFIAGQVGMAYISNELNARRHLETLTDSFRELDSAERSFLEDPRTLELVTACLEEDGAEKAREDFSAFFRRYFHPYAVITNYIMTSEDQRVIASSYGKTSFSAYLINYIYAACYRASREGDGVYRTVYYDNGEYADPLYILPVRDQGEVRGYLTLLLSGSSWNYMLSEKNFDGVVTDLRNNVMYTSKYGLVTSMNKYRGRESSGQSEGMHGVCYIAEDRYWVVSSKLEDRSAIVYSLVYAPRNGNFFLGILIMLLMGYVWQKLAKGMAGDMAERNASSIDTLVKELRIIRKEDPDHRVRIDSGDEFSEVGMQINRMMDSIHALNSQNTELIRLNARFEMNELTAQMNPHFLYNTLEIIRNLVYFDAEKASELIGQLTEILRYSVSRSRREVPFSEDMEYIEKYLRIQFTRFGDRLACSTQVDPDCADVIVPRLLLQPILENSIKYGFRHQMELEIRIRARLEDGILTVVVADNGGGMEPDRLKALQDQLIAHDNSAESIGLRNLSRRLYLRYGPGSGLSVRNTEGPGLEVTVTINTRGGRSRERSLSIWEEEEVREEHV